MNARAQIVALAFACCCSLSAVAQQKPAKPDDLDVTMQIIVDPNAKLPDEVVRRIPLPASRASENNPARPNDRKSNDSQPSDIRPEPAAGKGQERAQEARELGSEAAQRAHERAREAQEQREDARNSNAGKGKDKDQDRGKDRDRPTPPGHSRP
jgi:hypothetical protein